MLLRGNGESPYTKSARGGDVDARQPGLAHTKQNLGGELIDLLVKKIPFAVSDAINGGGVDPRLRRFAVVAGGQDCGMPHLAKSAMHQNVVR